MAKRRRVQGRPNRAAPKKRSSRRCSVPGNKKTGKQKKRQRFHDGEARRRSINSSITRIEENASERAKKAKGKSHDTLTAATREQFPASSSSNSLELKSNGNKPHDRGKRQLVHNAEHRAHDNAPGSGKVLENTENTATTLSPPQSTTTNKRRFSDVAKASLEPKHSKISRRAGPKVPKDGGNGNNGEKGEKEKKITAAAKSPCKDDDISFSELDDDSLCMGEEESEADSLYIEEEESEDSSDESAIDEMVEPLSNDNDDCLSEVEDSDQDDQAAEKIEDGKIDMGKDGSKGQAVCRGKTSSPLQTGADNKRVPTNNSVNKETSCIGEEEEQKKGEGNEQEQEQVLTVKAAQNRDNAHGKGELDRGFPKENIRPLDINDPNEQPREGRVAQANIESTGTKHRPIEVEDLTLEFVNEQTGQSDKGVDTKGQHDGVVQTFPQDTVLAEEQVLASTHTGINGDIDEALMAIYGLVSNKSTTLFMKKIQYIWIRSVQVMNDLIGERITNVRETWLSRVYSYCISRLFIDVAFLNRRQFHLEIIELLKLYMFKFTSVHYSDGSVGPLPEHQGILNTFVPDLNRCRDRSCDFTDNVIDEAYLDELFIKDKSRLRFEAGFVAHNLKLKASPWGPMFEKQFSNQMFNLVLPRACSIGKRYKSWLSRHIRRNIKRHLLELAREYFSLRISDRDVTSSSSSVQEAHEVQTQVTQNQPQQDIRFHTHSHHLQKGPHIQPRLLSYDTWQGQTILQQHVSHAGAHQPCPQINAPQWRFYQNRAQDQEPSLNPTQTLQRVHHQNQWLLSQDQRQQAISQPLDQPPRQRLWDLTRAQHRPQEQTRTTAQHGGQHVRMTHRSTNSSNRLNDRAFDWTAINAAKANIVSAVLGIFMNGARPWEQPELSDLLHIGVWDVRLEDVLLLKKVSDNLIVLTSTGKDNAFYLRVLEIVLKEVRELVLGQTTDMFGSTWTTVRPADKFLPVN